MGQRTRGESSPARTAEDYNAPELSLPKGTQLGPYRIDAPLGAGGMGEVYRARDTRLDRDVAIKVVHEQFSDRFQSEARAISRLNHPHICTVHDVGPNYLVMELLDGESLADRLTKRRLPFEVVIRYGSQIADALAAAHTAGIIHRDLKTANIMLTKAGAKVLDFGIARLAPNPGGTITATAAIIGTPAYMAPEQLAGASCDQRADIFALSGTRLRRRFEALSASRMAMRVGQLDDGCRSAAHSAGTLQTRVVSW